MSIMEFIAFACGAIAAWLLMAYNVREEERHARKTGGICMECNGDCAYDEELCAACKRVERAKQMKDGGK
jgi:hypothetical protein